MSERERLLQLALDEVVEALRTAEEFHATSPYRVLTRWRLLRKTRAHKRAGEAYRVQADATP